MKANATSDSTIADSTIDVRRDAVAGKAAHLDALHHFDSGHRAGRDPDLPVSGAGARHAGCAHAGRSRYAWAGLLFRSAGRPANAELAAQHAAAIRSFRADRRLPVVDPARPGKPRRRNFADPALEFGG